jgi:hypothetical protein
VNAQGVVSQGATPFGVNAFGERLDASGNVWDPATATTDIYGGQFRQVGEVRWERNRQGRLVKVKYGKGGKKTVVAGGKGQAKARRAAEAARAGAVQVVQPVQKISQNLAPEQSASAFVTFRT